LSILNDRLNSTRVIRALATIALLTGPAACSPPGKPREGAPTSTPPFASEAMLPDRIIVHPLTHAAAGPDGRPMIFAHVELRDRFNQNTRALGLLTLSVRPPGAAAAPDADPTLTDGPTWPIDLSDPAENARLFDDLVTRTYLLRLTDLPPWLAEWTRNPDDSPPSLDARFQFADTAGRVRTVRGSARLAR
ncbi:MAG: hypothetical protein ACK4WH_11305, partial [Phycisphaerales bacterium]